MDKKDLLLRLVALFSCFTLNGAAAPAPQWDSTYLTSMRALLNDDLQAELNKLFAGYSGKKGTVSTEVIAQVRRMVDQVVAELGNGDEDRDLFTDSEFVKKLELFKGRMAQVSKQLAQGAQQKTSFHKRPESNRVAIGKELDSLEIAKEVLLARMKYVQGKPSPEQQRRATMMQQQQARDALLKRFSEFILEVRKDPKVRIRTVDKLYEEAVAIQAGKNAYLTSEQDAVFARYLTQITREKGSQDGKAALMAGHGPVLFEVPGENGDPIYMEHRPQEVRVIGTFRGEMPFGAW